MSDTVTAVWSDLKLEKLGKDIANLKVLMKETLESAASDNLFTLK